MWSFYRKRRNIAGDIGPSRVRIDLETVPVERRSISSVPAGYEGVADQFALVAGCRLDPEFGAPIRLFDRSNFLLSYRFRTYDVAPDGKRFLMIQRDPASVPRQLNVILNWPEELKRLVPTK